MLDIKNPSTLKPAREAAGLTVAELARKSGVYRDTIERIEAGKHNWRIETFFKLETALI